MIKIGYTNLNDLPIAYRAKEVLQACIDKGLEQVAFKMLERITEANDYTLPDLEYDIVHNLEDSLRLENHLMPWESLL